jgi:hypothetical protein
LRLGENLLVEKQLRNVLLVTAFALAFAYRFILLTWQIFPSGSDIGLHESVIKTITSGQTNFFENYYHMGGGASATNPGYHIFVTTLIAVTGLPDYLAQAFVAAIFSAITILCIFLIVKSVWNSKAAYLASFIAVFSAGDISMLSWGGYPNMLALMLIPAVFFLFVQKDRFSRPTFLVVSSLLIGSLFLTHVFSSLIFAAITVMATFFCLIFYKRTCFTLKTALSFLIPMVLGALLVSPYLYSTVPNYFGSGGTITGASIETNQALLETRAVSISVLVISLIFGLTFFVLSKIYKNKTLTFPAVLFATWLIAPAIMTQSYLLGLYVDFERFLYFLYLPLIVCVALLSILFFTNLPKVTSHLNFSGNKAGFFRESSFKKTILALFCVLLFFSLFASPLLSSPFEGLAESAYYQVMTPLKFDGIQWIKNNTLEDAVLVADSDYGWWLSGFAQRKTLSAVDPRFLILAHEIGPAKAAKNILSTDYLIDNGILQINYVDNSTNSVVLSSRIGNSIVLYPFFYFKKENISLIYRINGQPSYVSLNELGTSNIEVNNGLNWASFTIKNENEQLIVSEVITVQKGSNFAKVSLEVQSKSEPANFDWLTIPFICNGVPVKYQGIITFADHSRQANTSIVLPENLPVNTVNLSENSDFYQLTLNNNGASSLHFEFSVGLQADTPASTQNSSNQGVVSFDYKKALTVWNVSYVVVTDKTMFTRFTDHQLFGLVYQNAEVEIYKIKS